MDEITPNETSFENLPTEILVKILDSLEFKDLLHVSEVSKKLHFLATDPLLWKDYEPSEFIEPDALLAILKLDRFRKLKTVHLCQEKQSVDERTSDKKGGTVENESLQDERTSYSKNSDIFESLLNLQLKHLSIQHFDLTSIDKSLLSRVINSTENVYLNHCVDISDNQIAVTIEDMVKEKKVKGLQIEKLDLSRIETTTLSRAINSLERFYSLRCNYTRQQLEDIFHTMAAGTNLRDFSIFAVNGLEKVLPETFAKAFNNLESVYIGHNLAVEQLNCFFHELSRKSSLKKLLFMFKDSYHHMLTHIPSEVLAKGLNSLDTVVMPYLRLTNNQMKDILEGMAKNSSCVKSLDLGDNIIPDVSLEVLKNVVTKLEPNSFKLHLQGKILEIYEKTLESLKRNLLEKEVKQAELLTESKRLREREKVLRYKLVQTQKLRRMTGRIQVTIWKKSKFSSSFRSSTRSKIHKKPKFVLKIKLLK